MKLRIREIFCCKKIGHIVVSACIAMLMMFASQDCFASNYGLIKEGNKYFKQGNYVSAEQKYRQALKKAPESGIINFDLGTALYKKGDYQHSIGYLQKALLSEDDKLRQKALYNLGNALYKEGISKENKDIGAAINYLQKALSKYKNILSLDSKDKDAQYNYKFVEKELKRLQKKKRRQEQQRRKQKQKDSLKKRGRKGRDNNKQNPPKDKKSGQKGKNTKNQVSKNKKESQQNSAGMDKENKEKRHGNQKKDKKDEGRQDSEKNKSGQVNDKQKNAEDQGAAGEGNEKDTGLQPRTATASQSGNAYKFDKFKAQMLLKNYQQTEEPKGLLNFYKGNHNLAPVLKDW